MSDCAIGPDGKLLDVKDIEWYEDIDSSEPLKQVATPSSMTTASSSATIHPIFRGGLASARRSGCAVRPSNGITDPDNAETLSFNTMHKCKASGGPAASRRVNCKVTINLDDEGLTDSNENDDYEPNIAEHPATTSDGEGGDTEPEEDFDLAYASTKAMGDVDREVSLCSSL